METHYVQIGQQLMMVTAPGLLRLVAALSEWAEITVVAPDRDRSGASHSLSLKQPLYVTRHENGFYSVEGTSMDLRASISPSPACWKLERHGRFRG
ncbi:MAG: 5'/3'-nucleotidase SurE [Candidatus Competibacteraceae bacterium]|nr:5'/3'-nucleotidase SurE [Candidatus Competibacteraceae bacterium]